MEKGNANSSEPQRLLLPSPFKELCWCLIFENKSLAVSFGYSVLELLVRFRENPAFLSSIWNFFDNDQDIKQMSKQRNQITLFTCFKQLLNFISIGKYIEDLKDLRSFILSQKYWIPCIDFYFSIPDVINRFPVHVILYLGQNYDTIKRLSSAGPLIILRKQEEAYNPVDLSDFKPIESIFPFTFDPNANLAPYLN